MKHAADKIFFPVVLRLFFNDFIFHAIAKSQVEIITCAEAVNIFKKADDLDRIQNTFGNAISLAKDVYLSRSFTIRYLVIFFKRPLDKVLFYRGYPAAVRDKRNMNHLQEFFIGYLFAIQLPVGSVLLQRLIQSSTCIAIVQDVLVKRSQRISRADFIQSDHHLSDAIEISRINSKYFPAVDPGFDPSLDLHRKITAYVVPILPAEYQFIMSDLLPGHG